MSYRLQHIPAPLAFDAQTLLYDLPSPPTSPRPRPPTSPRSGRPTPPPRSRAQTPLGIAPSDLELFAEHCRAWYFCQDDDAGRRMTQTLATLPSSQRAPFSRLQASIRSAYHRSVNARRHAEFQAHLSATMPGGSLIAHARSDPRSHVAQKERYERMERFVRSWCNMGMPGTKPFFEALWAIFRLQVLPTDLGGAGRHRIDWELDDAVFKEAAGKDFMLEAIDFLKGVLAFEETPSPKSPQRKQHPQLAVAHSRAHSQPLSSNQKHAEVAVQPKRARAPSDPFLDAPNAPPLAPSAEEEPPGFSVAQEDLFDDDDGEGPYLRIWTSPDLANPEIHALLKLFPAFITRRALPRFNASNTAQLDIEEGEDDSPEGQQIRFGTGLMWISSKERTGAWEGGWWERFLMWWRRIFC